MKSKRTKETLMTNEEMYERLSKVAFNIAEEKWLRAVNISEKDFEKLHHVSKGCALCCVFEDCDDCLGIEKRDFNSSCCYQFDELDTALGNSDYKEFIKWSRRLLNKIKKVRKDKGV